MQAVKVVFHIDEPDKWPLLLGNVRNLTKAVDSAGSDIQVLANSKAVLLIADAMNPLLEQLLALTAAGVRFLVCQNSLNGLGISAESLPDYATVVPVGVLELINRQAEGFAYIKP